jgi:hypothetical protein
MEYNYVLREGLKINLTWITLIIVTLRQLLEYKLLTVNASGPYFDTRHQLSETQTFRFPELNV